MRKLIFVVAFFAIALGWTVVATADSPTYDGTDVVKVACNNKQVPAGYYESAACEGDLPGLGSCKNAIAFNIDNFACAAVPPSGTPPTYGTYCADGLATAECTNTRKCLGETINGEKGLFTQCSQSGMTTVTTRLKKVTLQSDLPSPYNCKYTVSFP